MVTDELEHLDKGDSINADIYVKRNADFRTPTPPSMHKKGIHPKSSQKRSYSTQLEERIHQGLPTLSPQIKKQKRESQATNQSCLQLSDNMIERRSLTPKSSK